MSGQRNPYEDMKFERVIGIDFGASFTKLAFRDHEPSSESNPIYIEGKALVPTLGIETDREDSPWIFGNQAASIKPGKKMTVHRNWKSDLLRPDGEPPEDKIFEIALHFFKWLLKSLSSPDTLPFDPLDATVMVCVPAFKESGETMRKLASVMKESGWNNKLVLQTTEPKANTIGYCTEGRNIMNNFGMDWGEMLGEQSTFIRFTRQHLTDDKIAVLAILDIGSFTSDLSLISWKCGDTEDYLSEGSQHSFRHGIVEQLDAVCLPSILDDVGESIEEIPFEQLEVLKTHLYQGDTYELGGYTIGEPEHKVLIDKTVADFAEKLWQLLEPIVRSEPIKWFLLTGGGSAIPSLRKNLEERFENLREGSQRPRRLAGGGASRNATAIGATSIILTKPTGHPEESSSPERYQIEPLPPLRNCSCGGLNKNCMRCGGTGVLEDVIAPGPPRQRNTDASYVTADLEPTEVQEFEPEDISPPDEEVDVTKATIHITEQQVVAHTLEGWMGTLVFGSYPGTNEHNYRHFKFALESDNADERNRCWYRLLCLACALGSRVPRSTIQTFWNTTLEKSGFWDATTGPNRDPYKLDQFFESLIHRDFRSVYADGEQSELLRRVFYDFRKLQFLVYENDFAEVILELLSGIESGTNPVLFLRSGAKPDGSRWKGVIGQSMTSPLLFLMREWRRAGLITSGRMDHYCYYMNTAARRGAYRRGWLDSDRMYAYSLPDILDSSQVVHRKLLETKDWDPLLFDIPLQIIGSRRGRRRK